MNLLDLEFGVVVSTGLNYSRIKRQKIFCNKHFCQDHLQRMNTIVLIPCFCSLRNSVLMQKNINDDTRRNSSSVYYSIKCTAIF